MIKPPLGHRRPAGLRGSFAGLRREAVRARQVSHWLQPGELVDDIGAMTDLARPLRERSRESRHPGPDVIRDTHGGGRHAQVAALDVGRHNAVEAVYHPRGRSRHAVHLVAGRPARSTARSARPA